MVVAAIPVSGVRSGLARFETAAVNIANSLTPAFKSSRIDQVALKGGGTAVGSRTIDFSQGPLSLEGGFSLAIDGPGFFQLQTPAGLAFTRAGAFRIDSTGNVVSPGGEILTPSSTLPNEAQQIIVTSDGRVLALLGDGSVRQVGEVPLAGFANPGGLEPLGSGLFAVTPSSGPALPGASGRILFGALEGSNVDLAEESLAAVFARSSFEANLALLREQDEAVGDLLDVLG